VHVRRKVLVLSAAAVLAPKLVIAQAKVPRIGLLWLKSETTAQNLAALQDGLREHGFVEGRNFRFERRDEVASYERLPQGAAELVQLKVDLILAWGDTATQAAGKATSTIPIVMVAGSDPVKSGLAASLARPRRNVTGFIAFQQDLVGKRLELLKEAVPGIKSVAVLMNPTSAGQSESLKRAEAAAEALGLRVHLAEVRTPHDIEIALQAASRARVDAVMAVPSVMFAANRARIVELTSALRLPTVFTDVRWAEEGALMSYGGDTRHNFRFAAAFIARILKGANPGEMPIERATRLYLSINLKTAKAIGITIPSAMVLRADQVIE
jgi:putative tryptophan/tyrosine transport system substrate-binding protein